MIQVGAGLYPAYGYAPTRLNIADDPTREKEVRPPAHPPPPWLHDFQTVEFLMRAPGLKAPLATWLRWAVHLLDVPRLLTLLPTPPRFQRIGPSAGALTKFDSTKGYPGEGPSDILRQQIAAALRSAAPPTINDTRRALQRRAPLPRGKVVTPHIHASRAVLLATFGAWLARFFDKELEALLEASTSDPREINELLEAYGQYLWRSGAAFNRFPETINAVVGRQRLLHRRLGVAWDVAFQWKAAEPGEHHLAIPKVVLLALVSSGILWGWPSVSALLLLGFTALLRTSEFALCQRQWLVFPRDVLYDVAFLMVIIPEPKTRLTMAKQQSVRVDYHEVITFLESTFGNLAPHERLWPLSTPALRRRFVLLCQAMGLPTQGRLPGGGRPLELGGLRGGGATALLLESQDSELVRRKGRWANPKVMEIYLQELSAVTLLPRLPAKTRQLIMALADAAGPLMQRAAELQAAQVPAMSWPAFFASERP
jgi:hypothetical protein